MKSATKETIQHDIIFSLQSLDLIKLIFDLIW